MTKKSGKGRNPTRTTDNYLSSHWGEKPKQTKVTPAKESEIKGSQQAKFLFLMTGNNISPPTPTGITALKVITPEDDHAGTNCIRPPRPPTNPKIPPTTQKNTPNTNTNNTTTEAITTKTPPPQSNTVSSDDNNKKPAAGMSNTTSNDEFKEGATTTQTEKSPLPSNHHAVRKKSPLN
jgi:hypothetical protein